jgi:hypothetical protein
MWEGGLRVENGSSCAQSILSGHSRALKEKLALTAAPCSAPITGFARGAAPSFSFR